MTSKTYPENRKERVVKDNSFIIQTANIKDWFSLHFINDVHIGGAGYNEEKFKEKLKIIEKDPRAMWIGMGDYGEHIYYNDPRFSLNEVDDLVTVGDLRQGILGQVKKLADLFQPIKNKCIGLGTGNHEETVAKRFHVDPTRELCYKLNTRYLGYSCISLIKIRMPRHKVKEASTSVRVFTHHGYGGGRRSGTQVNKIEDAMRIADADIYAMGHVHGQTISQLMVRGVGHYGQEYTKKKTFVVTGCYQNVKKANVTTYAERQMYPESPLGSPVVQFRWLHGKVVNVNFDVRVMM